MSPWVVVALVVGFAFGWWAGHRTAWDRVEAALEHCNDLAELLSHKGDEMDARERKEGSDV